MDETRTETTPTRTTLPPAVENVRLPSAFIPKELDERMRALCTYRGDLSDLIVTALTREVERRERKLAKAGEGED